MSIETLVEKFNRDFGANFFSEIKRGEHYLLKSPSLLPEVEFKTQDAFIALYAKLLPIEGKINEDEAFTSFLLSGNFLGRQTLNSALGISSEGLFVTLTRSAPVDKDYRLFKDVIEDFLNSINYWSEQIKDFLNKRI